MVKLGFFKKCHLKNQNQAFLQQEDNTVYLRAMCIHINIF